MARYQHCCTTFEKSRAEVVILFSLSATDCLDCVRDPYSSAVVLGMDMTLQVQEEITALRQDRGLKLSFADLTLGSFG